MARLWGKIIHWHAPEQPIPELEGLKGQFTLDVGNRPVTQRTAVEGVILRTSDKVSSDDLKKYLDQLVVVEGEYDTDHFDPDADDWNAEDQRTAGFFVEQVMTRQEAANSRPRIQGGDADAVQMLRDRIQDFLNIHQVPYSIRSFGDFEVRRGSTVVLITPMSWGNQTMVKLGALVAQNIENISPEFTRYLAEQNYELAFGKFTLDARRDIVWYQYSLLGNSLDDDELINALGMVAYTADQHDEKIVSMCGGRRAVDS